MSEIVQRTIPEKNERVCWVDNINNDVQVSNSTDTFKGFPTNTLLESRNVPIEELAELALREGQRTSPFYQVHRWFARRLSSQFRGMLAAISLDEADASHFWDRYFGKIPLNGAVVLDPFVGGGTSVVEASRCGARVIGYDIDPVAAYITSFELDAVGYKNIPESAKSICTSIAQRISPYHKTTLKEGEEMDVLHHFWVELSNCGQCDFEIELHPHYQLNYDKEKGLQWVFCRQCHEVYELPLASEVIYCSCGIQTKIREGTLCLGKITCPCCSNVYDLSSRDGSTKQPPRWKLFAQEYLEPVSKGFARRFKAVTDQDLTLFYEAAQMFHRHETSEGCFAPGRAIPIYGRSDQRPLTHGFRRYRELFNERQLLHLTILGKAIRDLASEEDKRLLGLAFSDHLTSNCMYTGYAFGYRKISPLFSIHSYRHITRPVELNPWAAARGTFPNALNKIYKAIDFAKSPSDLDPRGGRKASSQSIGCSDGVVSSNPSSIFIGTYRAAVIARSSLNLTEIPDQSVHLILTDPPYFDNLSYSELSDFYLVWLQALGLAVPPYDDPARPAPIQENLAVSNRSLEAIDKYRKNLSETFSACYRVLHTHGMRLFTYHHRSSKAWLALGEALASSGLESTSVVPLRSEGRGRTSLV